MTPHNFVPYVFTGPDVSRGEAFLRTLCKGAKAFITRNLESAAEHRFEVMPNHLLDELDVTGAPAVEGCGAR